MTGVKGVDYFLAIVYREGQVSVVPEMAHLAAQEQAARNGVSIPQSENSLSFSWQGSEALRNQGMDPPHLLHGVVFSGQGKDGGNGLYL